MSNITDNLLISESTATSTASLVTGQTNKDKPSLFDSLLSNISTTEEINVDDTTTVKTEVKGITTNLEETNLTDNIELQNNVDVKDLESVKIDTGNNEQKLPSSSSLLDKLVIEAKKNIKETDIIGKESAKLDTKIENDISSLTSLPALNTELSSSVEIEKTDLTNNLKLVDNIDAKDLESVKIDTENKEQKLPNSLMDKLILETKESINETDKIKKKDIKVEDSDTLENKIENSDILSIDDKKIENLDFVKNKEEVVNGEIQNKEELKTSSLLDRLIIEAKKDNENIINTEIKEEIAKPDIKLNNTDNLIKINDENSSIVENKKIEELSNDILKEINKLDAKEQNIKITPIDSLVEKINTVDNILSVSVKEEKKEEDKIILDDSLLKSTTKESEINNISLIDEVVATSGSVDLKSTTKDLNIDDISAVVTNEKVLDENKKIDVVSTKKDEKLSLMDQLIQKNSEKLTLDTIGNNEFDSSLKEVVTKDLISSIYLGSQKNKINSQSLFNKNEAISLLKDGNSIQSVKTSAEMLDLGLEDVTLDQNLVIDKSEIKQLNKKSLIENIFLEKNVKSEELKNLITKSVDASNALIENSINLANDATVNVNSPISYNIQSKIIGAKQQMSAMMSDIAKQMYENYKPPVTAFKINLNPTELGSIAILMKSDKNSGLSITMNASNNVTLETLIENQNVLKNSLNKTFDESTKFNLDFSSSNQNTGNQSSSNSQSNNRQFEQQMGTQEVLKLKEDNKETEEKVIDYM